MRALLFAALFTALAAATAENSLAAGKGEDPDRRSPASKAKPDACQPIDGRFENTGVPARDNPTGRTGTIYLSDALGQNPDRLPVEVELHLDGTTLSGTLRFAENDKADEVFTIPVRCIDGAALLEFNQIATNPYPTAVRKKRTQVRLTETADGTLQAVGRADVRFSALMLKGCRPRLLFDTGWFVCLKPTVSRSVPGPGCGSPKVRFSGETFVE